MKNWSSWQGYGCLTHICTGVYILCCGARSIPIRCWYRGTSWQSIVEAVLLLFRPFCTCSCTRCANQKCSSQGAPCSTFTLGTVLQHDLHATERIATLKFAQWRTILLRAADHLDFLLPWLQLRWILSNHSFWPDYQAQQSLSCHFFSFCVPSFPWRLHLARHIFLLDIF